jgi:hypothetical protein
LQGDRTIIKQRAAKAERITGEIMSKRKKSLAKKKSTKRKPKSNAINVRFGTGDQAKDWFDVVAEAVRMKADETDDPHLATNQFVRDMILRDPHVKKAAKKMKKKLVHPPGRGQYDRGIVTQKKKKPNKSK